MDSLSGELTHQYQLTANGKFAVCTTRRTSASGDTNGHRNCIFVGGQFANPYAFAEYRSIFDTMCSAVRRSGDGRLLSGLFFPVRRADVAAVTVFFTHTHVCVCVSRQLSC